MLKIIVLIVLLLTVLILCMFWQMIKIDKNIEKEIDRKYTREKYYNDNE